MVQVDVGFYFPTKGEAVHLRHHPVADNQIGRLSEDFFHGFLAIRTFSDVVFGGELQRNETADFVIVFYDEDVVCRILVLVFRTLFFLDEVGFKDRIL